MKRGLNLLKNIQQEVSESFLTKEDDIPWLEGRPDKIIDLDNYEEMKSNNIYLQNTSARGDYYSHFNSCKWMVIERKEGTHRFRHAITQVKSTALQLQSQGYRIDYIVIVLEKISKPESGIFGVDPNTHEVYSRLSQNKNKVSILGITLRFYKLNEVRRMREKS
jgi:hypothetical protein